MGSMKTGKSAGIAGFVIALISLILYWLPFIQCSNLAIVKPSIALALAVFWTLFSISAMVLSGIGVSRAKKTGGKKGLAITGLIISILTSLLSLFLVYVVIKVQQSGVSDMINSNAVTNEASFDSTMNNMLNLLDSASKSDTTRH